MQLKFRSIKRTHSANAKPFPKSANKSAFQLFDHYLHCLALFTSLWKPSSVSLIHCPFNVFTSILPPILMCEATETSQQLRRRIDHWQDNVLMRTKSTQPRHLFSPVRTQNLQTGVTAVKIKGYSVNGRSLRPTARRLALQEIPVNLAGQGTTTRTRKRKRERSTMSKEPKKKQQLVDGKHEEAGGRGSRSGMTTRSSAAGTNSQGDFRTRFDFPAPSQPPSQPPSSAGGCKTPVLTPAPSSSSRLPSPRKGGKSADQPVKENEITLAYLAHCEPAVIPYTREKLKKDGVPIPAATEELYEKIRWARACIPNELKAGARPPPLP